MDRMSFLDILIVAVVHNEINEALDTSIESLFNSCTRSRYLIQGHDLDVGHLDTLRQVVNLTAISRESHGAVISKEEKGATTPKQDTEGCEEMEDAEEVDHGGCCVYTRKESKRCGDETLPEYRHCDPHLKAAIVKLDIPSPGKWSDKRNQLRSLKADK